MKPFASLLQRLAMWAIVLLSVELGAQPNRLIPFQARLVDATGNPIPDGARIVQFQIFGEPTGGAALWAGETHRVSINGGLVNVVLGTKNPLPSDRADDPSHSFFDASLYLQITVDANGDDKLTDADPPLLPRQSIVPVAFAIEAARARVLADHAVSLDKLASEVARRLVPAGTIVAYGGGTPPPGWLLCDGRAVLRSEHSVLFEAIKTFWGRGDDQTTFNLPDLRGVFLRGVDDSPTEGSSNRDPERNERFNLFTGGQTGNNVGSYQDEQLKQHTHTFKRSNAVAGADVGIHADDNWNVNNTQFEGLIQPAGGKETRPKNAFVNYIIKN